MTTLSSLARRYRHERTAPARRNIVRDIRAHADFAHLAADDSTFATLIGAPTLGVGATAEESPVQLMLLTALADRDLITLAFQRYHTWAEILSIRMNPAFPASSGAALLDQHWYGDRPLVRFARWLSLPSVDWGTVLDPSALARRPLAVHGPPTPFAPTWLADLDEFATRFRPHDRILWLVRAIGLAGTHALDRLDRAGSIPAEGIVGAVDELLRHPDPSVMHVARQLIARRG